MDVEFRINRSETSYKNNHKSWYLNENIYALFASCFANSVDHGNSFNYYGPTKFQQNELLDLRSSLSDREQELKLIDSVDAFNLYVENDLKAKYILSTLAQHFDLESEWDQIFHQIIETNRELINLVSLCIRENYVLWVLGL